MKKYYIKDTTLNNRYVYFNRVNELVSYFEAFIPRAFGMTKNDYVQHLADLGHNHDSDSVTLTRVLSEQFDIGVVKKNGAHLRTDVHAASIFLKEEYGD